jgi:hypothetical protein
MINQAIASAQLTFGFDPVRTLPADPRDLTGQSTAQGQYAVLRVDQASGNLTLTGGLPTRPRPRRLMGADSRVWVLCLRSPLTLQKTGMRLRPQVGGAFAKRERNRKKLSKLCRGSIAS